MTDLQQPIVWGTGTGGGVRELTGLTIQPDWDHSLVPGSPGLPIRVGLQGFTLDGTVNTIDACPFGPPTFAGIDATSIPGLTTSGQVGIAICTGPAPSGDPIAGYTLDESDLTVLQTWLLADVDHLLTWWPLTAGIYYYVAAECWDIEFAHSPPQVEGCNALVRSGVTAAITGSYNPEIDTFLPPTLTNVGPAEEIFPISAEFGLAFNLFDVAQAAHVVIDWGDGNTETYDYDATLLNADQGVTGQGLDWIHFTQIPPRPTEPQVPFIHAYAAKGLYQITVTVTDGNGGEVIATKPVAAVGPPTATLVATPMSRILPGAISIVMTSTSDAWDLMGGRSAATNPDGYDPTSGLAPVTTHWLLTTSGHPTGLAFWSGVGTPPSGWEDGAAMPPDPFFPLNSGNIAIASTPPFTVEIELDYGDTFIVWEQLLVLKVHPRLVLDKHQRNVPRDDGFGISTARSYPPQVDSIRSYPHIP